MERQAKKEHAAEWHGYTDKGADGTWADSTAHYEVTYRHLDDTQFAVVAAICNAYGLHITKHTTTDRHVDLTASITKMCHTQLDLMAAHRMIVAVLANLNEVPFTLATLTRKG